MKLIGGFTKKSRREPLRIAAHTYQAIWEKEAGFVEMRGLSEYKVRVDDAAGQPVVFMRWLVADIQLAGGKDGLLQSLESYSPDAADWATCLAKNCSDCTPSFVKEGGALALLALIASAPAYQGQGLGTPLAKAFAETVLARHGVRAIWIKPVPLTEHPATGIFKPVHAPDTAVFLEAVERLEQHYRRSLDAQRTCPDYLRADLAARERREDKVDAGARAPQKGKGPA